MKNWGKRRAERGNEGVLFWMEWRARQKETGRHERRKRKRGERSTVEEHTHGSGV